MKVLILVDIQNDFLPGGALPVPCGDEVVPVVNRLIPQYELVIATQDWHPSDHGSFASSHPGHKPGDVIDLGGVKQVLWPDHCVQATAGADFAPGSTSPVSIASSRRAPIPPSTATADSSTTSISRTPA